MLGQKRSTSVFQNTVAPTEDTGNQPLSSAPELTTEVGNRPEASERFASLQFGPDFDVLNPPQEQETAEPIATEPESAPIRDSRPLRAHGLFFAPVTEGKDFSSVLSDVQEYISANYSTLITGTSEDSKAQMKGSLEVTSEIRLLHLNQKVRRWLRSLYALRNKWTIFLPV